MPARIARQIAKLTAGQVRRIVKEMDQPPFGSRKRTRVSQKRLVARSTKDTPPKSGPVKRTQTGVKKTRSTIAAEKEQRKDVRLEVMQERLKKPTKVSKPAPSKKILLPRGIPLRDEVTGTGLRGVMYRGRLIYLSPGQITALTKAGKLDMPKVATPDRQQILKRDLNLTPQARARLDAEEARLAREANLSASKQYKESKVNPRVQNPMDEAKANLTIKKLADERMKAIIRYEKSKAAAEKAAAQKTLKKKTPLRPKRK